MRRIRGFAVICAAASIMVASSQWAAGDPCGMVPPAFIDQQEAPPIVRSGDQKTYVFYQNGIETFVIRPGFSGKVDEFGMLIPFPTPPAVRKVPDQIFSHVAAAIDPPEVIVDVRPQVFGGGGFGGGGGGGAGFGGGFGGGLGFKPIARDEVRVVREEAVGMYEVAVLEAGSAAALKRWIDQHGYVYPKGMDQACNEYVDDGWCFVAVKTKVGDKQGVDPKPGQRKVDGKLPKESMFDGHVQAMGFRFHSDHLVVPMRLSTFNEGNLDNIVYVLTAEPSKIQKIPEEYVVRQVNGRQLYRNLTGPLPVRIIGGTEKDISGYQRNELVYQRNPGPSNGHAKELFSADLMAARRGDLSLPKEDKETEYLNISERLGLRGPLVEKLHAKTLSKHQRFSLANALHRIKSLTMTVISGDFPREVLAGENLQFSSHVMPEKRNTPGNYDAKLNGPAAKKEGILKIGALFDERTSLEVERLVTDDVGLQPALAKREDATPTSQNRWIWVASAGALIMTGLLLIRSRKK